ncbi:Valine--tRNA ligase, chloroplastic/mitochondrial 2 [Porphyridium purpureum]|uniref:valine--tRNA ligase n=1 Tax=Porphyridium purpureum TaxID=35688 RepID=A0A5J4YWJ6_PORPP|nr:Valine--tRNA ligase, chloroplastic/mitochondrial 2 [Porphyridium purpureum]|eukprot:POR1839..scf209_3
MAARLPNTRMESSSSAPACFVPAIPAMSVLGCHATVAATAASRAFVRRLRGPMQAKVTASIAHSSMLGRRAKGTRGISMSIASNEVSLSSSSSTSGSAADEKRKKSAVARVKELREKLKLDEPMDTKYEAQNVEQAMYQWWEECGYFAPNAATLNDPSVPAFMMAMPPPNVTGGLHMGHAMFTTVEDIMTRYRRMKGECTLWLPGTDHAGIATQLLVERALAKESPPLKKTDLGREAFLERVWKWKEEKGGYITQQMRRLGASCDWSRERFTLDDQCSAAVAEAFVRLHEKGLIYRGEYMVNWSPNLQTAVSDLEVEFSDEQGKLYYFKYMLEGATDADEYIPVATTRPETILGDSAVCVHPEDPRFKKLIGKKVLVPILGRSIPVIADDYVDREFGTGALKITPAHDTNDYEIGKRHGLEMLNIMNADASINAQGGPKYEGLDRFDCRKRLWEDMEAQGLVLKVEDYTTRVPRSQRGGEIIEPRLSTQWFVRMESLAAPALEAVRSGSIQFKPERFEKVYYNWLENIHDWCISRQLWWGHRIPVWHVLERPGEFIVARSEQDARDQAERKYGPEKPVTLEQDPDVLDTWFSSGLWPFATLGWPNETPDLARFYPNVVMETGYDILFFWVSRMIMMGIEFMGKPPFSVVYMHGLVRDAKGKKMSKTVGNVIDPLDMIDQYNTDALRYTLVTGSTPGQDIPLSQEKVEANRNFANKLWNSGRYILGNLDLETEQSIATLRALNSSDFGRSCESLEALLLPERYILSKLTLLVDAVTNSLDNYSFGESGRLIQEFLWDEFADWYIEISKTRLASDDFSEQRKMEARCTLLYVFDSCLRLLHPFMPYVTEAVWQRLPHDEQVEEALIIARWPAVDVSVVSANDVAAFQRMQALVRAVRNARAEYQVEPKKRVAVTLQVADKVEAETFRTEVAMLALLARIDPSALTVEVVSNSTDQTQYGSGEYTQLIVAENLTAYLPLADLIDVEKERARLEKQQAGLEKNLEGLRKRLSAPGFAERAPADVVQQTSKQAQDLESQLAALSARLTELSRFAASKQ